MVDDLVTGPGVGVGASGLGDVADAAAYVLGLLDHVVAGHRRGAGRGPQQRRQHPQRGGLAGAVGPEEPDDLALLDVEVDAVDGAHLDLLAPLAGLEGLYQPSRVDHPSASSLAVLSMRLCSRLNRISVQV